MTFVNHNLMLTNDRMHSAEQGVTYRILKYNGQHVSCYSFSDSSGLKKAEQKYFRLGIENGSS
jgi:hypothetical protein